MARQYSPAYIYYAAMWFISSFIYKTQSIFIKPNQFLSAGIAHAKQQKCVKLSLYMLWGPITGLAV
jgi:hypothetical protein